MRLKALLLITALGATALPATAQSYSDNCRHARGNNQAAGLVLGGILGGVLGSNVAGRGHRGDGTAVGAVVGGLVGSEIGRSGTDCRSTYYGPNTGPGYSQGYPSAPYNSGYATGPAPGYYPPPDYGYYPEGGYADDYRYDRRDARSRSYKRNGSYGYDNDSYRYEDDYAGRDCENATQITRLPDGTEIRRQVDACRDAYYGGWKVRD